MHVRPHRFIAGIAVSVLALAVNIRSTEQTAQRGTAAPVPAPPARQAAAAPAPAPACVTAGPDPALFRSVTEAGVH